MKKLASQLWHDDDGGTYAFSVIIFTTVVGIGAITGLSTVRDQIVQQFGDIAVALENLDQSYDAGIYGSYTSSVEPAPPVDISGNPPDGIAFSSAPSSEG